MSILTPANCTLGDICTEALRECGRLGIGQTALAEDMQKAWARCQFMLQEWQVKRWLVYHLVTYSLISNGQTSYTFGPGGEINTNSVPTWQVESLAPITAGLGYAVNDTVTLTGVPASGTPTAALVVTVSSIGAGGTVTGLTVTSGGTYPGPLPNSWTQASTSGVGFNLVVGFPQWGLNSARLATSGGSQAPRKIESAFLRQIQSPSPNQVDFYLDILQAHEDYDRIRLKSLQSFPGCVFLDSAHPLGNVFCYPVPQASIYSINLTVMEQLQTQFATLDTPINLPFEYYSAILYNLALRCRQPFQIPTYPGDMLPGLAKNALATVRGPNTQIARLGMPKELVRPGIYNIFSDSSY